MVEKLNLVTRKRLRLVLRLKGDQLQINALGEGRPFTYSNY